MRFPAVHQDVKAFVQNPDGFVIRKPVKTLVYNLALTILASFALGYSTILGAALYCAAFSIDIAIFNNLNDFLHALSAKVHNLIASYHPDPAVREAHRARALGHQAQTVPARIWHFGVDAAHGVRGFFRGLVN